MRTRTGGLLSTIAALTFVGAAVTSCANKDGGSDPSDPEELDGLRAQKEAHKDKEMTAHREDIRRLPKQLKARLVELAGRPHTYLPLTVFAEARPPSQLFAYYLLDATGFEASVFTSTVPGINDGTAPTAANCANRGLPTIGAIRLVVEPKPGLPRDPNDPGAFIDVFTDISGLFVINNESGWYEGWMIHDLKVPQVAGPRGDGSGHAQFGTMTEADAAAIAAMGRGNDVPGNLFTVDGNPPAFPKSIDHFPDRQSNLLPIFLSMGAWNALQQSDAHAYWEFNQYTDWVFPLYELPFTGGSPLLFKNGVGGCESLVPGSGPSGVKNDPAVYGDNPSNPRDPDRLLDTSPRDLDCPAVNNPEHKEKRLRFIPSGLANEVLLDVFVRLKSFESRVTDVQQRLFDAYAAEVARIDENRDGVLDAEEADLEDESDGLPNDRLFILRDPRASARIPGRVRLVQDRNFVPRACPPGAAHPQGTSENGGGG